MVGVIASTALLGYGVVLALRVSTGGPGHIGGDLIAACYLRAGFGVTAVGTAFLLPAYQLVSDSRKWALLLASIAALVWLYLNVGGHVYSYESMFCGR